jgi:hypothetical protein
MKYFKKDLHDAAIAAKALTQKIEQLQKQFAEMEKKHPKMPARKAPTKKATAKKTVTKKAQPKKKTRVTATDTVLKIINRSNKGVTSATIVSKTGYDKRKVANLFAVLKKQGRIKNSGIGVYVKG